MRHPLRPVSRLALASLALLALATQARAQFQDFVAIEDTHVASGNASPQGANTTLFLQDGAPGDPFGDERIWLKFDLTGRLPDPSPAGIVSASLRLYLFRADNAGTGADLDVEVFGAGDGWVDSMDFATSLGIPLDTTPATGDTPSTGTLDADTEFLWYDFDVTDFVRSEAGGDGIVSLVVKAADESVASGSSIQYRFNSREFLRDGYSLLPRLRVHFSGSWSSEGSIRVLHTNDLHSRLTTHELDFPDAPGEAPALEEAGGAALLAAKIVERKKAHPHALVLDAGDVSEGNPLGDLRGNGGTVDYFQLLDAQLKGLAANASGRGVDAVVVGNHDVRELAMFENMTDPDGDGVLNGWIDTDADDIVDTFNPPGTDPDDVAYVAVNILREGATKPAPSAWPIEMPFRPYVVIDVDNGSGTPVRTAVLGYLTDDSAILTSETVDVIDVLEAAWTDRGNGVDNSQVVMLRDWVEHLRAPQASGGEGADIVILLSHIGHRRINSDGDVGNGDGNDELMGDQGDLAPADLVVSGHWHTWTETAWQPVTLNYRTTIVEAASYAQYLGEVELTPTGRYVSAGKHPIRVADFSLPFADPEVQAAHDAMAALVVTLEAEYDALSGPDDDCVIDAATVQLQVPGYVDGHPCPLDYVVGYSAVDLLLDKDKWNTLSEFPWSGDNTAGEWIADGMAWKLVSDAVPLEAGTEGNTANPSPAANPDSQLADLAIQSGGGIRRDIAKGAITYREIFETYPWSDDEMVRVQLSSQDIWNYVEGHFVGSSLSRGWTVWAHDGLVTQITYDHDANPGTPAITLVRDDDSTLWNVVISEFMYQHDDWINESGGFGDAFSSVDDTPEFLGLGVRDDAIVPYTAQFTDPVSDAMDVSGPRYVLNTEIASEFEAVVTMLNDAEDQPYFEGVFVRLLAATPETLARRGLPGDPYGLVDLVDPDGSIALGHEFGETLLYRSHLGFPDGFLQVGDVLRINGEFGFFEGNPQFVDQDGVVANAQEFTLLGHDPALAAPQFAATASEVLVDPMENHLVRLYGTRAGDNQLMDATGALLTLYREGGFFTSVVLPGSDGDCLTVVGVPTERADGGAETRRFRLRDAAATDACFPPASAVTSVTGAGTTGSPLLLSASAQDLNGVSDPQIVGGSVLFLEDFEDAVVGYTTSTPEYTDGAGDFFTRSDGTNIGAFVNYTGVRGTSFFAAMDLDGDGAAPVQSLLFSGIDVAGAASLQLAGFFAEDDDAANQDWDEPDFFLAEARLDGGAWQPVFAIENDGSPFNSAPFVDTDFDGTGDGAEITSAFTEHLADIPGTGTTLDLRFTIGLEAGDEDIAFDDVRILEAAQIVPPMQLEGTIVQVLFQYSTDGGATWLDAGTDLDGSDGWSVSFTPLQAGSYQFRSIAKDSDSIDFGSASDHFEPAPYYPDFELEVTPGQPIPLLPTGALALLVLGIARTLVRHARGGRP